MIFQNGIGIDFRQNSISVALLKASFTGVKAGGYFHHEFPRDMDRSEKIRHAGGLIKSFIIREKVEKPDIYMALPRELMIVREAQFPSVVKENLHETITYELDRYIPLPVSEIYLDHLIIGEKKEENQIRVMLVAARKEDIDAYIQIADIIGNKLAGIEFRATAITDFILLKRKKNGSRHFVHLYYDGDGAEMSLNMDEAICYSRYFRGGEDQHGKLLSAIIDTQRQANAENGPLGISVFGEKVPPQIIEHLEELEGISPFTVNIIGSDASDLGIIGAQSLAMRGISTSRNRLNLLPRDMRKQPSRIPAYFFLGLTGLIFLSALLWGGAVIARRHLDIETVDARIAAIRSDVERVRRTESELKNIVETLNEINTLRKQRVVFLDILNELTLIIPRTAWIRSLDYKKPRIQIEGVAEKATELIPLIEKSPMFSGVRRPAITRENNGKERFRVEFNVADD